MSFGPPSDSISIGEFAQLGSDTLARLSREVGEVWRDLGAEEQQKISEELSIQDMYKETERILTDEALCNILSGEYNKHAIKAKDQGYELYSRKEDDPAGFQLLATLEQTSLQHWPPHKQSVYYFRKNKRIEENALTEVKPTTGGNSATPGDNEVIVTISFHSRPTRGASRNETTTNALVLDATFAFLSSQTLQNVFNTVPCPYKNLPQEIWESSELIGYETAALDPRAVYGGVVIENEAYGSKERPWARSLEELSKRNGPKLLSAKKETLSEVRIGSLSLKLHTPYWLIHHGNCMHCWVVDSIRLLNPDDPVTGYPLQLFMNRQTYPTCLHCGRNPVKLAINGDHRLGESPSRICEICWKMIDGPSTDPVTRRKDSVLVVPFIG
ncbi:hypothetical protein CPB86DRAFT_871877 [Serendipita vermifera]|nr:hypothetical protein CPB86DRAFT_871877 [Serendipita vermifera]